MFSRWIKQLKKEWELSVFITMLGITMLGSVFALATLLWSSADDAQKWISPTAKLRHINTSSRAVFRPLGNQHAMRVQVPSHYRPHGDHHLPSPPQPPNTSKPTVPPAPKPVPAHVPSTRHLVYNGIFITPGKTPLALFRESTVTKDTETIESRFIGENGTIDNFRVTDITADHVTLIEANGTTYQLPRATRLRLH